MVSQQLDLQPFRKKNHMKNCDFFNLWIYGAFFWRMTTPFKTFFLNSGLPFFTLHSTRSPGEQFLGISWIKPWRTSPVLSQRFGSNLPLIWDWNILRHTKGTGMAPIIPSPWPHVALLPYITPSQDKRVFLPTKGREFVQAAANANNSKDVEIPQGGVHDPNNIQTWLGTWVPIFIHTQKQWRMPVAGIKEATHIQ